MKTLQNKTKTDAQREEQKTMQPKNLQQMLHQPQDHSAILQYMKNQHNPAYHAPILQAVQQFKAKNGLIVQRNVDEEDLQMKKDETVQRNEEDDDLQLKAAPIQKQENKTGLPDNLKSGIENLSGYSMDDVKVHYNSDKPAQLHAHAYAQGTEIHIASGQEKHLPHEAWHVVQQKQGRVQPTMQMKGNVNINDNARLEKEADVMGAKAENTNLKKVLFRSLKPIQQKKIFQFGGQGSKIAAPIAKEVSKKINPKQLLIDDLRLFYAVRQNIVTHGTNNTGVGTLETTNKVQTGLGRTNPSADEAVFALNSFNNTYGNYVIFYHKSLFNQNKHDPLTYLRYKDIAPDEALGWALQKDINTFLKNK
jgi:hypothetical protein